MPWSCKYIHIAIVERTMKTQNYTKLILCMTFAAGVCICIPAGAVINLEQSDIPVEKLAVGTNHTIGVKADGMVEAAGFNDWGEGSVENGANDFTDIVQVATTFNHTVGLTSWGEVVAVGDDSRHQCDAWALNDFYPHIQVAASYGMTIAVTEENLCVAQGTYLTSRGRVGVLNQSGTPTNGFTDIVQVSMSDFHTIGLKSTGEVVAVGYNDEGQCNVGTWNGNTTATNGFTDIVQVVAARANTVGLKSDGTVVATPITNPSYDYGQSDVGNWEDIVQIAAGAGTTIGLKSDGTCVATPINDPGGDVDYGQADVENGANGFTDIVQIAARDWHTAGLKSNGEVVTAGDQYNVSDWDLSYTIKGYAKLRETGTDVSGTGINGATVILTPGPGVRPIPAQIQAVTTTVDGGAGPGYYEIKVATGGDYEIITEYSGLSSIPYDFSIWHLTDTYEVNFYSIFGYVTRYGTGEGINGVAVTVVEGPTVTNLATGDRDNNPVYPGFYEKHVGFAGGSTVVYTVEASNP